LGATGGRALSPVFQGAANRPRRFHLRWSGADSQTTLDRSFARPIGPAARCRKSKGCVLRVPAASFLARSRSTRRRDATAPSPSRRAVTEWRRRSEARRRRTRACRFYIEALSAVIASDSDAIQTKPPPQSPSLDRFALLAMLAMTAEAN